MKKSSGVEVPTKEWLKAIWCWIKVTLPYLVMWLLTFPLGIIVAATASAQKLHPQGKPLKAKHSSKYIAEGSSGEWKYTNSNIKFLKNWNNYEDGLNGEPSGKHSAHEGGKEDSFLSRYRWIVRNPFNCGKRTNPLYHCLVNNCTMEYWGDYDISDKDTSKSGWYLVKAIDKTTGRVYYNYRSVKHLEDGQVRQGSIGYKIKPSHANQVQDDDDLDKAFTIRLPVKTMVD
jgi:hypothetical protein